MSKVCISADTNKILKDALRNRGHDLIEIKSASAVYDAIASHSDIYLCKPGSMLIVAPGQLRLIEQELRKHQIDFLQGEKDPGSSYPENIGYNGVRIGNLFVHNIKHSDPIVLREAQAAGLQPVTVNQGYTKCSLVIVDHRSAITADAGIASVLQKHDVDVLQISPGSVVLKGFPYGFLGGASGRVGNEMFFNGDLSAHPDFDRIASFILKKGLQPVWFEEYPLTDIGSVIEI